MSWQDFIDPLLNISLLILAVAMFASHLPKREGWRWRLLAIGAAILIGVIVSTAIGSAFHIPFTSLMSIQMEIIPFTLVLLSSVAVVMLFYDTSVWTALFCCTAGYATQNLWAATDVLANILIKAYFLDMAPYFARGLAARVLLQLLLALIIYPVAKRLFANRASEEGLILVAERRMLAMMAAVILLNIVFSSVIKAISVLRVPLLYVVLLSLVNIVVDFMLLAFEFSMLSNRRLEQEMETVARVMEGERRQYELSKENIQAINIKCHDLRHQIRHLQDSGRVIDQEALREMAQAVDVYDNTYHTGNEALDVILTEKALLCSNQGISLACIVDGATLNFMKPADIYSLFGNALDNAIEAVSKIQNPERNTICVKVRRRGSMVAIHVANPYDGEITMRDGVPQTTKGDTRSHGFGTQSIKLATEKYGGYCSIKTEFSTYSLNILIPAAEASEEA